MEVIFIDAAGTISYSGYSYDTLNIKNIEIRLNKGYKNSWSVLSHEVGHYFSIKYLGDDSEEGADRYARILILNMLNIFDRLCFMWVLNIYFPEGGKNNGRK